MIRVTRTAPGSAHGRWGMIRQGDTREVPQRIYDAHPEHYKVEGVRSEDTRKAALDGASKSGKVHTEKTSVRNDGDVQTDSGTAKPTGNSSSPTV